MNADDEYISNCALRYGKPFEVKSNFFVKIKFSCISMEHPSYECPNLSFGFSNENFLVETMGSLVRDNRGQWNTVVVSFEMAVTADKSEKKREETKERKFQRQRRK